VWKILLFDQCFSLEINTKGKSAPHRNESGNPVPHALGRHDRYFITDPLVRVEVQGETRVVLFNDGACGTLNGLCADTLLKGEDKGVNR
jgi:hypothetical protein